MITRLYLRNHLSFDEAVEIAKESGLEFLVIRSKSDPKYKHDRFKLLFATDAVFPAYDRDEAPGE